MWKGVNENVLGRQGGAGVTGLEGSGVTGLEGTEVTGLEGTGVKGLVGAGVTGLEGTGVTGLEGAVSQPGLGAHSLLSSAQKAKPGRATRLTGGSSYPGPAESGFESQSL